MIIDKIKTIALELCKSDLIWEEHLQSVVDNSIILAEKLNADKEICEISAWIHDNTKIRGIDGWHHIEGAKEARKILEELNYRKKK